MSANAILAPLWAQVLLTFLVWIVLYRSRIRHMRHHGIPPQALADETTARARLGAANLPAENLANLFELPVLFYALVPLLLVTGSVDAFQVVLAWIFVAFRYVHSFIHITYNRVVHRFIAYVIGSLALWAMWLRFAVDRLIA